MSYLTARLFFPPLPIPLPDTGFRGNFFYIHQYYVNPPQGGNGRLAKIGPSMRRKCDLHKYPEKRNCYMTLFCCSPGEPRRETPIETWKVHLFSHSDVDAAGARKQIQKKNVSTGGKQCPLPLPLCHAIPTPETFSQRFHHTNLSTHRHLRLCINFPYRKHPLNPPNPNP